MSQISGASAMDRAVTGGTPNRFSDLQTQDFLRIIFTELTNQDPLQPNDTKALLDQLNSIRSIESDVQLTNQLRSLVTENQLASAGNLLGKLVEGRTENFDRVTGIVVSAIRRGDSIEVELDTGDVVPFTNIDSVIDPNVAAGGGPESPLIRP